MPPSSQGEVYLLIEELESLRLKDVEKLEQEECAKRMHISRPTFHRLLELAREKVADALIHGKAIRVSGGNFAMDTNRFRCDNDGHEWEVPFETMKQQPPLVCPACQSPHIFPVEPGLMGCNRGRGRGRHRNGRW